MANSLGSILPSLAFLDAVVQDNTLAREFNDALFPELLYRAEATPEKWEANLGERQVFTRSALLPVTTAPLTAGTDPGPEQVSYEQWEVTAKQHGKSMDTHLPSSRTALASIFARNAKTLGLNAGQTLNRLARNRLFCSYVGGDTVATAAGTAVAVVPVSSINGFTDTIVNGRLTPVSASNPKTATLSGVGTVSVIGTAAADPLVPFGPGTLTLSATATWAADARVKAADAPTIIRPAAATTIDGLTSASLITLRDIREAVATLQRNRVPKHPDGYYHVHMDPLAVSHIFGDNEFQRLNQSLPDGLRYSQFAIGHLLGCLFFTNNESPNSGNTGTQIGTRGGATLGSEILAETANTSGVPILRTIVTGGGSIMEKYIDESAEYISEAGHTGKVGAFNVVNNGIEVPIERTRYIIRAPLDRLQQVVSQSWSASLDFGVPSDLLSGQSNGRFKRAVVIESGSTS